MTFPPWVPASIAQRVTEYRDGVPTDAESGDDDAATASRIAEIWTRLATRPEMEVVWRFISRIDNQIDLTANGGLLGTINRRVRSYDANPKFSPKGYSDELLEISKLAEVLSRKLKKFSDAETVYNNPFPLHSLFSDDQMKSARAMMHPDLRSNSRNMIAGAITYYLPSIDDQLMGLSARARIESEDQFHRLKLPRKVSDKNTFRTYFIRMIVDYFFGMYADYSPTRTAIFCSVALDDADITADLVRKLCPLDEDQKAMLKVKEQFGQQED